MPRRRPNTRPRRKARIPRRLVAAGAALIALVGLSAVAWLAFGRGSGEAASHVPPGAESPMIRLAVQPAPRPTTAVAFEEGCVRADCHARFQDAPVIHVPAAEDACDACHAPDTGGHVYPQRRPRGQVCSTCHDTAGHRLFQHKAMSEDACLACHDPHVNDTPALLAGVSAADTCARCHPRSEGRTIHPPYAADRCESCHDPHGADNSLLLLGGAGADHCRLCHASTAHDVDAGAAFHADVRGSCLACHSGHASDHDALLPSEPRDLCVSCHATIGATIASATVSHDPVLTGHQCVSCHDPHDSRNPRMLRNTQAEVCLSCHEDAVTGADGRVIPAMGEAIASSPVVHGAVRHGDCSACHSVHGATHERLLREIDPDVLPGPYDRRNYALCFSCHDPDLAEAGATTLFRDGARNLHEVHLRSESGASGCGACHAVHAGELPRLIATTVNYQGSDWGMPMGFELAPDGGSCAPPCHEPMSYHRTSTDHPPADGGSP